MTPREYVEICAVEKALFLARLAAQKMKSWRIYIHQLDRSLESTLMGGWP